MKKFILWLLIILILGLLSFVGGYYFSSGGLTGLPGLREESETIASVEEEKDQEPEDEEGYRIRLMGELDPEKGWKESDEQEIKETREEEDGAVIIRRPLGEIVMGIILDGSGGLASPEGKQPLKEMVEGLKSFLKDPPRGVAAGVRTMGGEDTATCKDSRLLIPVGEKDFHSLGHLSPNGPRNVSRAMYLAAGDMAVHRGRKGLVILTAGDDQCGEWPEERAQALFSTKENIRTYVLRIAIPSPNEENEENEEILAGVSEEIETEEEKEDGMLSLVNAGGGFLEEVTSREDVTAGLRRVADELSRNLTVRFFRPPDRELLGRFDPRMTEWNVNIVSLLGPMKMPVSSSFLPARVWVPPGHYHVIGTYGDSAAEIRDLDVGIDEEVEVRLSFRVGQLLVLEDQGGWPESVAGCRPLIRVYRPENMEEAAAERCGLPAQFVLPPGGYVVAAHVGEEEAVFYDAGVKGGRATVLKVSPEVEKGPDEETGETKEEKGVVDRGSAESTGQVGDQDTNSIDKQEVEN